MSYEVFSIPNSGALRNGRLSVAVSNIHVRKEDIFASATGHPNLSGQRHKRITNLLNHVLGMKSHVDLIVLPEVSIPHSYLSTMQRFCRTQQIGLIFGMEHRLVSHQNQSSEIIGTAYNHVVTLLPSKRWNWLKECETHMRLKRYYSPAEMQELKLRNVGIPSDDLEPYQLFHWRQSYFTVFNCYELANVEDRAQFRSKIDFMVTVEWNPDVNYFSNIAESSARDLHCYFIQVNTSQFGDSRIVSPSKTEEMNILRTKGGKNETVLIQDLNIEQLREFQQWTLEMQNSPGAQFKMVPPNFDDEELQNRIANNPPFDSVA